MTGGKKQRNIGSKVVTIENARFVFLQRLLLREKLFSQQEVAIAFFHRRIELAVVGAPVVQSYLFTQRFIVKTQDVVQQVLCVFFLLYWQNYQVEQRLKFHHCERRSFAW